MGRGGPRTARPAQVFREFDALAYDGKRQHVAGEDATALNHVAKRRQKSKGAEVVFNPAAHKEYLTGFRKRKLQRKKDAAEHVAKKQRMDRNQQRIEKRTALKHELGLGDNFGVEPSSDEVDDDFDDDAALAAGTSLDAAAGPARHVDVFNFQGMTTTVTTVELDPEPDALKRGGDGEESSEEEAEAALGGSGRRPASAAAGGRHNQAAGRQPPGKTNSRAPVKSAVKPSGAGQSSKHKTGKSAKGGVAKKKGKGKGHKR